MLERDGRYDYCAIFDNSAELLSNMQISPMDIRSKVLSAAVRARPLNTTFSRQDSAARSLYGGQIRIPKLSRDESRAELEPRLEYYGRRDRGIIAEKVCEMILARQRF